MMPGVVAGFPRSATGPGGTFTLSSAVDDVFTQQRRGYSRGSYGSTTPADFNYFTGAGGELGAGTVRTLRMYRATDFNGVPTSAWTLEILIRGIDTAAGMPATMQIDTTTFSRAAAAFNFTGADGRLAWTSGIVDALLAAGDHTVTLSAP